MCDGRTSRAASALRRASRPCLYWQGQPRDMGTLPIKRHRARGNAWRARLGQTLPASTNKGGKGHVYLDEYGHVASGRRAPGA